MEEANVRVEKQEAVEMSKFLGQASNVRRRIIVSISIVSYFSVDVPDVSLRTEVSPCPVVSSFSQASCGGQLSVS